MSILFNGSYVNTNQQLWANLPSLPTTTSYVNSSSASIGSGFNFSVNNLIVHAQYLFTLNLAVFVPSPFGITLTALNDGTNSLVLQCSSSTSPSGTNLPLELVPSSTGTNLTTYSFPGAIEIQNTWALIFNGTSNRESMPFTNQIILTPQTTTLYFSIQNVNTSPTVPNSAKILDGGYITATLLSL